MPSPSCIAVQEELPWLVNGSLTQHQQRALWQHLTGCRDCRSELVGWTRTATTLREFSAQASPTVLANAWQALRLATTQVEEVADHPYPLAALLSPLTITGDAVRWAIRRAMIAVYVS